MKITENTGNDPLKKFLNKDIIEKAPESFTEKVMASVRVEPVPHRKREKNLSTIVPLTAILIIAGLIILALLTPQDQESTLAAEASKLFQYIKLPSFKSEILPGLTLPAVAIYISLVISVLVLCDLAIGKLFQRRR